MIERLSSSPLRIQGRQRRGISSVGVRDEDSALLRSRCAPQISRWHPRTRGARAHRGWNVVGGSHQVEQESFGTEHGPGGGLMHGAGNLVEIIGDLKLRPGTSGLSLSSLEADPERRSGPSRGWGGSLLIALG
jgi:hypothetical protein